MRREQRSHLAATAQYTDNPRESITPKLRWTDHLVVGSAAFLARGFRGANPVHLYWSKVNSSIVYAGFDGPVRYCLQLVPRLILRGRLLRCSGLSSFKQLSGTWWHAPEPLPSRQTSRSGSRPATLQLSLSATFPLTGALRDTICMFKSTHTCIQSMTFLGFPGS